MSHLYLLRSLDGDDEIGFSKHIQSHHILIQPLPYTLHGTGIDGFLRPARRLPSGRRCPRPQHLDAPTLSDGNVPAGPDAGAARENAILSQALRRPLPVLGVRRGFPRLDGAAQQRPPAEQPGGIWALDVPGA